MKWFKHQTKRKAALKKIIMEFGMEGYGLYWLCVELIAGEIEIDNLTFELEEDATLIAHEFKIDTVLVEKIMHRCVDLGLFDLADSGKLRCLELAKLVDDTMSRNPQIKIIKEGIKKLIEKLSKIPEIPEETSENSEDSSETPEETSARLDKIRLDKIRREEEKKRKTSPSLQEFKTYCEEKKYDIDAVVCWNYYEGQGWTRKSGLIKDWRRVPVTWMANEKKWSQPKKETNEERIARINKEIEDENII